MIHEAFVQQSLAFASRPTFYAFDHWNPRQKGNFRKLLFLFIDAGFVKHSYKVMEGKVVECMVLEGKVMEGKIVVLKWVMKRIKVLQKMRLINEKA